MVEIIRKKINSVTNIIKKIIEHFKENRKWKLRIYFLNQLVCTKRIEKFNDVSEIFKKPYICKVHKKHFFKTSSTQIILIPSKALFLDEDKRQLHINCIIYEGVGINEV